MIKSIEIENIKGIGSGEKKRKFELNLLPNKPSLLIAPNGFGKSSLTIAFKSLNGGRIKLERKNFHQENEQNRPLLKIKYQTSNNIVFDLYADEYSNTISDHFDYFVINNRVRGKELGTPNSMRANVRAALNIDPIVLIESIPEQIKLEYDYAKAKENFGEVYKVFPNLSSTLNCLGLLIALNKDENLIILNRSNNRNVSKRIIQFKERLKQQSSTESKRFLINWIKDNEIDFLNNTPYLSLLSNILQRYGLKFKIDRQVESCLAAIQIIDIYQTDKQKFRKFCKRKEYELDKISYKRLFKDFNTTWLEFKPREKNNSLVLKFPKTHLISNGQRDVLCFMALLEKAKKKLRKDNCILIIDEVFDYLDEANLVAVQYYTTQFIEEFKLSNRRIYSLILTHLDPLYFKGYVFGRKHKLKTYYLSKNEASVSEHLVNVLKQRNMSTSILKTDIEKYLLHFHINQINRRHDFQVLKLKPTWGELNNFDNYIFEEAKKYYNDEEEFDPLAVCCAVRKRIEKNVFNLINEEKDRDTFLNVMTGGTNEKLEFAESIGVQVNETYYFLGIIYNEALHWKDDRDLNSNVSPSMANLKNLTIKKLIKTVFQQD